MCHANYPTVVLGEMVRDRELLTLERGVQMMTEAPARLYGLKDRGTIAVGSQADLMVFDADRVGSEQALTRFDLPAGGERLFVEARVSSESSSAGARSSATASSPAPCPAWCCARALTRNPFLSPA